MKKIKNIAIVVLVFALIAAFAGCGETQSAAEENEITELLNEGYEFSGTSFDDTEWRGLFVKDNTDFIVVKAKMDADKYAEIEEVFSDDVKYHAAVQTLEVKELVNVSDKLPGEEELQAYVGKTFGELEEEGFYNTGYCESDNYQYNFSYENDYLYLQVKSSADTPIYDMADFSENDIKKLVVEEVVDCTISSNVLYAE